MIELKNFLILCCLIIGLFYFCLKLKKDIKSKPEEIKDQDLINDCEKRPKTYYSEKYGIKGKPDTTTEINGEIIPIEQKSTIFTGRIYPSHRLQIAAYCLLIEEETGKRPSKGMIEYVNHKEPVYFTDELRANLLTQIKRIQNEDPEENGLPPLCNDPWKCKHCGFSYICFPEKR